MLSPVFPAAATNTIPWAVAVTKAACSASEGLELPQLLVAKGTPIAIA